MHLTADGISLTDLLVTYLHQIRLHAAQKQRLKPGYQVINVHQDLLSVYMSLISAGNIIYRAIPVTVTLGQTAVPTRLAYVGSGITRLARPIKVS